MNSDLSSANLACAASAASRSCMGRSRASCTDRAEAMISISARHWCSRAARIIRPMRGSTGSLASSWPVCVSAKAAPVRAASASSSDVDTNSIAPSSCSRW
ncbi:hypothetical protein D3C85_1046250 [compost metagenome]